MSGHIVFYRTKEKYGEFSNFARFPVEIDGITWKTNEHYYQAQKFLDDENQQDVFNAKTAKEAANIGRDKNRPLREDWDNVKNDVMRKVVLAKFEQHENLKKLLLETGDVQIVEFSLKDEYWGVKPNGVGLNMLGKILMEVRDLLRKA